jgi:uncharacterized protein
MRAIAIFGIIAVAGAVAISVSTKPATSQSPDDKARCLSISDVDRRVECLENAEERTKTAPSPMPPAPPQVDRELECRNPQDAALCRELEREQGFRGSRPQPPTDAYRPPPAQVPPQYGMPKPSFNCADAATVIEQAICSDATLAQWDGHMGRLYRQGLSIQNNSPSFVADQRRWRALRDNNCSGTEFIETKSCVLEMTKARVGGLAAVVAANGGNPNSSPPISAPVPNPPPPPVAPARTVKTNPLSLPTAPSTAQAPKPEAGVAALERAALTMANSNSAQLLQTLIGLESPNVHTDFNPHTKQYTTLLTCSESAVKRGSRSAVGLLRNECAREYLDWFPTCDQSGEEAASCAVFALHGARLDIEHFLKWGSF